MSEKDSNLDKKDVGVALRYLCQQAGMTQQEVADKIDADTSAICLFEKTGTGLGKKKLNQLPGLFGCKSLPEMVQKANALTWEEVQEAQNSAQSSAQSIALALRYLREQTGMTQQEVADKIDAYTSAIYLFEKTGAGLGRKLFDKLPALFKCRSLPEMVEKANALDWEQVYNDGQAIAIALRYLREQSRMTLQEAADRVGATNMSVISYFEKTGTGLGKDKLDKLPALFQCKSLPEMVQKANNLTWEQVYNDTKAIAIALRYLREQSRMTLQEAADRVGTTNVSVIANFERTGTGLGKDKLDKLPELFGFKHRELKKMVDEIPAEVLLKHLDKQSKKGWFIEKEELRRRIKSCMKPDGLAK